MNSFHYLRPYTAVGAVLWTLVSLFPAIGHSASVDVTLLTQAPPSETAAGPSEGFAISTDGRFVGVISEASNLIDGQIDDSSSEDVFLIDRVTGEIMLVSHAFDSDVTAVGATYSDLDMSADGRFVVFSSRSPRLVANFSAPRVEAELYVFDRSNRQVQLVSRALGQTTTAPGADVFLGNMTDDGRYIAYTSPAEDIVPGLVAREYFDVFVFDRLTGSTVLASHASGRPEVEVGGSNGQISDDGRFVLFQSGSTSVVEGIVDHNASNDVFLLDRNTSITRLVSSSATSSSTTSNRASFATAISKDGSVVAFSSDSTNVVAGVSDENNARDLFLMNRHSGSVALVSRAFGTSSSTPFSGHLVSYVQLSDDGRFVSYGTEASNVLPPGVDTNGESDAFIFDTLTFQTQLVSRRDGNSNAVANRGGYPYAISSDGRRVLYGTYADNVLSGIIDENGRFDMFVFSAVDSTTRLLTHSLADLDRTLDYGGFAYRMSADGAFVLVRTLDQRVVPELADNNGWRDAFVFEIKSGARTLLSASQVQFVTALSGESRAVFLSRDNRYVLFASDAINAMTGLIHENGIWDANYFLRDRVSGATSLITRSASSPFRSGNGAMGEMLMTPDASRFAFSSEATDLQSGVVDPTYDFDIFLHERSAGTTRLVSHVGGSALVAANSTSALVDMDQQGRFVLFNSDASDLIEGVQDQNQRLDVFLYDAEVDSSILITRGVGAAGSGAAGWSSGETISADGRLVLLSSSAPNLTPGLSDTVESEDVFVFDRSSGDIRLVSHVASTPMTAAGRSHAEAMSDDGSIIVFTSFATDLVSGQTDTNVASDVFVRDLAAESTILVSHAAGAPTSASNGHSSAPLISADGRRIVFYSSATDIADGQSGIFLYDVPTGATRKIASGGAEATAISFDGQRVLLDYYERISAPMADDNLARDVVIYDAISDSIALVSRRLGTTLVTADGASRSAGISDDGHSVLFQSRATDLENVAQHPAFYNDAFLAEVRLEGIFADGLE